ncbi:hypothetical protein [Maribacter sp. 2210JD10-5]|uniref:hypothetical protein n=1 Tax=Maribacter sp. 2210JD10-5 TaxID=3386272 RepID=UPI0039BD682E
MNFNAKNAISALFVLLLCTPFISCEKETDLVSSYVVADDLKESIENSEVKDLTAQNLQAEISK